MCTSSATSTLVGIEVPEPSVSLAAALSDRYRVDRDGDGGPSLLGQGGMARRRVAEAPARRRSLKRPSPGPVGHFSDLGRAAALAASSSRRRRRRPSRR